MMEETADEFDGSCICVCDVPDSMAAEDLELIFESRQHEGGDTEEIKLLGDGKALIKFLDTAVAERFIEKREIKVDATTLKISKPHSPAKQMPLEPPVDGPKLDEDKDCMLTGKTVLVKSEGNFPGKDYLKLYFESKRAGKASVKSIEINSSSNEALITFETPQDLEKVLAIKNHSLSNVKLQVFIVESFPELEGIQPSAIKVTGIPKSASSDYLTMFFESRRMKGGTVEDILYNNDGEAVVTFCSSEDAVNVTKVDNPVLDGIPLSISLLEKAPAPLKVTGEIDKEKLLVKRLPLGYLDEELGEFLKKASGVNVDKILRSTVNIDVAVTSFNIPPNYRKVRLYVATKPFKGRMISVQQLSSTSSIIIYPTHGLSNDMPMFYFENPKRSGGGTILNYKPNPTDGYTVIEFQDRQVINHIMSKSHVIEKVQLNVDWFYEDLGPPPNVQRGTSKQISSNANNNSSAAQSSKSVPKKIVPEASSEFSVKCDPIKIKFISSNEKLARKIDCELGEYNCKITWPSNFADGEIILSCSLATIDRKRFDDGWKTTCKDVIAKLFNDVSLCKLEISPEIFNKFVNEMGDMADDDLHFYPEEDSSVVVCVGLCKQVERFQRFSGCLVEKLIKDQKPQYETMKDLPSWKTALLKVSNFQQDKPDLKIQISASEVKFEGSQMAIKNGITKVEQIFQQIVSKDVEVPSAILAFMDIEKTRAHLEGCLKLYGIQAVYETHVNESRIRVYALEQKDLDGAVKVVSSEIVEKRLDLDEGSVMSLTMEPWEKCKKGLLATHPVLFIQVTKDESALMVITTSKEMQTIFSSIQKVLTDNTIRDLFVQMMSGKQKFIDMHMKKDILDLKQRFPNSAISITHHFYADPCGLTIKGTSHGIAEAEKTLKRLEQSVMSYEHIIDCQGIVKYFNKKQGLDSIAAMQTRHQVIIETREHISIARASPSLKEDMAPFVPEKPFVVKSEVNLDVGIAIKVTKGNIIKMSTDAIVNPTDDKMTFTSRLSKAISDAGGPTIQAECSDFVKYHGALLECNLHITKAGDLPFKGILHTACPKWDSGSKREKDSLQETIDEILSKSEEKKFKSLAMPLVCLGNVRSLLDQATHLIVSSILEFYSARNKAFSIKEIFLVDISDQVVNYFHEALITLFGQPKVKILDKSLEGHPTSASRAKEITFQKTQPAAAAVGGGGVSASGYLITDPTIDSVKTPAGVVVELVTGSIAQQQVEIIVNTTTEDINLEAGGVSKCLLAAAGQKLKDECANKKLIPGDILMTTGGNLPCKILHGTCKRWDGGAGDSEKCARDLLKKILSTAHSQNAASIAIPAIGTGLLAIPEQLVAKIMFEEVANFSKDNPTSKLNDVRFVIFDKNDNIFKAFKNHIQQMASTNPVPIPAARKKAAGPRKLRRERESAAIPIEKIEKQNNLSATTAKLQLQRTVSNLNFNQKNKSIQFNQHLTLEIRQGDLTKETTDAIVNSTNPKLDLTRGAVSIAIAKAGGPNVSQECAKLGCAKNGVAITNAGNLPCKKIIHLVAPENTGDWTSVITIGLAEAESHRLSSVSFPLLGTGQRSMKASMMAAKFMEAINDFIVNVDPKHLHLIRVVIYEAKMVDEFCDGLAAKSFDDCDDSLLNQLAFDDTDDSDAKSKLPKGMVFDIYAKSQKNIDLVIREIEELGKEVQTDRVLDSEELQRIISELSDEQIARIQNLENNYSVKITIDKRKRFSRIRIQGDTSDVSRAVDDINIIFREAEEEIRQMMAAEMLAKEACWQYNEDEGNYTPYPPEINFIIERAYSEKKPKAEWEESDGSKYRIDFSSLTEQDLSGAGKNVRVRRTAEIKITYPDTWDHMLPGETMKLVPLSIGGAEFLEIEKSIMATHGGTVTEIMSIHRIQNPCRYKEYAVHQQHMQSQNEKLLWHGTAETTTELINMYGFNRSYCGKNATVYGKGVYYAVNFAYSAQDLYSVPNAAGRKFIYRVRMLVGDYTLAKQEYIDAPMKPGSTVKYDSVVDNLEKPTIFVSFHDAQTYPEYLITFIKKM